MCELLAMSSLRPTRLTFSLETLASHGRLTGRTHDGWGAAFYEGKDVALFREPIAAGNSPLVRFLESQGPSSTLAISHIRRATRGEVTLANTQPFLRELGGRAHVFSHNGDLPGIEQSANLAYDRDHPVGTTDSEHAFCALLNRVRTLWGSELQVPPLHQRLAAVSQFAADLRKLGPAIMQTATLCSHMAIAGYKPAAISLHQAFHFFRGGVWIQRNLSTPVEYLLRQVSRKYY